MAVATFDTLKFANTLKAAGVPEKQAEAQAVAFAEMVQVNFKDLTTKEDLEHVRKSLGEKIDRLAQDSKSDSNRIAQDAKHDLNQAIADLKRDLTELRTELKHDQQTMQARHQADMLLLKWMLGATFTGTIAVISLLARLMFTLGR